MTDLREAVARALFVHEEDEASWFDNPVFHESRDLAMGRADAFLTALRDAGLAIVPKEPSEAMVEAHIESCAGQCDEAGPESVRAAWEAMLSAGDLLGETAT